MASLTLKPGGKDKPSMSHHFPGWDLFGITPKAADLDIGVITPVYQTDRLPCLDFCLDT